MHYRHTLLILTLALAVANQPATAQPNPWSASTPVLTLYADNLPNEQPLTPFLTYWQQQGFDTLSTQNVLKQPFRPYRPGSNLLKSQPGKLLVSRWLRFSLRQTGHLPLHLWQWVGPHDWVRLYAVQASAPPKLLAQTGNLFTPAQRPPGVPDSEALPVVIEPGVEQTYLLQQTDIMPTWWQPPRLYVTDAYWLAVARRHQAQRPIVIFFVGLMACLLFMSLFWAIQSLTHRDWIYGWYALYLVGLLVYFGQVLETRAPLDWWMPNQPLLRKMLVPLSVFWILFFYLLFLSALLDVPRLQPMLWRWYRFILGGVGFVGLVSLAWLSGWVQEESIFFHPAYSTLIFLLLAVGLLLTAISLRGAHPLRGYAFAGVLLLTAGAACAVVLNRYAVLPDTPSLGQIPSVYYGACTLLEVLCFSLALGQRSRLLEADNRRMQEDHAADLTRLLAQRTAEIEQQRDLLEAQRRQQREQEFRQELIATRVAALRAQMNPHFIFNCLNSIKAFIFDNDVDKADDYLTRFARLIRQVLENARSEHITLHTELDTLRLYLDMEAMRFKEKLAYSIQVSAELDTHFIEIPPMLVQPYVENAIWHGLMHKPEGGRVDIRIGHHQHKQLIICVTDNGVGRLRAAELNSKSANKHRSFGLKINADRIALLNEHTQSQMKVSIHDRTDATGRVCGTEVLLTLPM